MPRHPGMPRPGDRVIRKSDLLEGLRDIDSNPEVQGRVLRMEMEFRTRIDLHVAGLPAADAQFSKFSTSPYVLLNYSRRHGYSRVSEIESDILPAKVFSSMETSAGRMIEAVTLPIYGWECVMSEMHTANSALDGRRTGDGASFVATLKSGPRCLNDEMAENFADAVITNARAWAAEGDGSHVDFSYGVLYGTQRQSNKKDWHILRNLREKVPREGGKVLRSPDDRWDCSFVLDGVEVDAAIRIGTDWWDYLGGVTCSLEVWAALIRACVLPGELDDPGHRYVISDLNDIVSMKAVPDGYNLGLLQRSQLPWLFFVARHFCDLLID